MQDETEIRLQIQSDVRELARILAMMSDDDEMVKQAREAFHLLADHIGKVIGIQIR